jgi:quinoprotein glucose dehydrogenase
LAHEVGIRQFLVIMAGGHFMEAPIGDAVIAYALPN